MKRCKQPLPALIVTGHLEAAADVGPCQWCRELTSRFERRVAGRSYYNLSFSIARILHGLFTNQAPLNPFRNFRPRKRKRPQALMLLDLGPFSEARPA